ncbi:hypothetical protein G9F71_016395 [Clostridium sp. FP2]|uniref:hypothetical protein n=1 Tax=Clostridium sp. FP2 TaxID=2724481 RepID=UPI001CCB082C|nr:hypothetical protein [Clostridium sp. FP2]MBZ9624432.1 hypothetical protein [Clostridium sp. FP2]
MVDNLSEQEKPDFLEFQALKRAGMLSETIKLAKEQLRLMDGKSVVNNVHHLSIENYNYTLDNEDFDKNDEVACETIQVKRSIGTFGEDYVLNI